MTTTKTTIRVNFIGKIWMPATTCASTLTQAAPHGLVRAGNSIEWFKCLCGEESNLLWTYKTNKSQILACSLDCALAKAKAQVNLGYFMDQ